MPRQIRHRCAVFLLLVSCGEPARQAAGPAEGAVAAPASVAQPAPEPTSTGGPIPTPAPFVGVIVAAETVEVSSEVAGRVRSVAVRPGERVGAGAELARIEAPDLDARLASAEAGVREAEAEALRAETDLRSAEERAERVLAVPDLFSAEDRSRAVAARDGARSALEAARARTAQAEAARRELEGLAQRRVLRAPFAGSVTARLADPGALVTAGQPVLRLSASDRHLLRFAVPPAEAASWAAGRCITGHVEASGQRFEATVARVAGEVDPPSQMVFVEADLATGTAAQEGLRDGLIVRVEPCAAGGATGNSSL